MKNYNKNQLDRFAKSVFTKKDFALKLGFEYYNGTVSRKINKLIIDYNIDISHFNQQENRRIYKIIYRVCPVCEETFKTNEKDNKITCSHSCSNTYFRSGKNNGSYKGTNYRTICFEYHKKECIVCKEKNIVTVHHYDENKKNDNPENLIPLCPTHHQYWHSRYRKLVKRKIDKYREKFIRGIA